MPCLFGFLDDVRLGLAVADQHQIIGHCHAVIFYRIGVTATGAADATLGLGPAWVRRVRIWNPEPSRKAAMDNLVRLRQARGRVVKVQRRIWLLQVAFWPTIALGFIVAAFTVARLISRRRRAAAPVSDVTVVPPDRATGGAVRAPE